jgi:hypothetical protein
MFVLVCVAFLFLILTDIRKLLFEVTWNVEVC